MGRKARRDATRSRILSEAAKLVSRDGPEALSLREVARKSGYSPAGLYAYFTGRDAILAALAARDAEALAAVLRAAPQAEHPLVDIGLAWLEFGQHHPGRLRLALRHPGEELLAVFIERVEDCIATGEVMPGPGYDLEEIAQTLMAMAQGAVVLGHPPALLREGLRCLVVGLRG